MGTSNVTSIATPSNSKETQQTISRQIEQQILEWFTQLCLALKYIHGQNILHRDLKTQNIFLGKDDIIKLGDFGIARMLNSTLDHAQTTVGTPYYLSPEICQRKPYNHKSDMWSLGCVLYEMATLKHAFNANNFSALVIKILQGQYPPIPGCYGPLLEDLVSVLLQKNPDDRPSAKQLLYVPAMQPYVKKFLQFERDRTDSVASDISDISTRTSPDCSQISNPGKTEKGRDEVNAVKNFSVSKQEGQVKQSSNVSIEISRSTSSRERRLSSNKAPKEQEQRRASESVPNDRALSGFTENAPKKREPIYASDSVPKTREHLRGKCPAEVRKHSLLALAHAQQRRHSEQTSARSQPGSRIPKGRIHSQGGQPRDISLNEDDVFALNYPTVISTRKSDNNNITKARECKKSVSSAAPSHCSSRLTSVTEEKKQKPTVSVCQPKCIEDMRTRPRRQSAIPAVNKTCWPVEQKHQRLTSGSEINKVDKENRCFSHAHAQVTAKRHVSSGALKQIQTSSTENQPTAKTGTAGTGNEGEIRKRTYTVSQERRPSVFEIPEVDGQKKCNNGNGSGKDGSESYKDGKVGRGSYNGANESETLSVLQRDKHSFYSDSKSLRPEKHFNPPDGEHLDLGEQKCALENKRNVLAPSCKFTFCGKTLHLDHVASHDSIYSHMEALRMYLEKELGTRLLTAVYHYVTNVSLEEHERINRTVTAILGEDKMTYFPVLLQLVACEAIYFH
ncbi:hypothetical protein ACROYT_G035852 [Oculina patagonica]